MIQNQTIVDTIERGDVIVSGAAIDWLTHAQRAKAASSVIGALETDVAALRAGVLNDEERRGLQAALSELKCALAESDRSGVDAAAMLRRLNNNLGSISGIVTRLAQLAQIVGLR